VEGAGAHDVASASSMSSIRLPAAYSVDLDPVEQVFAKLKHLARKAQPRDVEATWRKVGQLLDLFSPVECANYLVNSGYGSV
jgi:transposase